MKKNKKITRLELLTSTSIASRPKTSPTSWNRPGQQFTPFLIGIRSLAALTGSGKTRKVRTHRLLRAVP